MGVGGTDYGPETLTGSGGIVPYEFAVTAGSLPNGLTLSSSGELTGVPTEAGSFSFTVTATDASAGTGTQQFTLAIDAPLITISVPALTTGTVDDTYPDVTLTAVGGTAPYGFAVTTGALPAGVALAADGTLSVTPTQAGAFTVTVKATDALGFNATTILNLTIDPGIAVPAVQDFVLKVMAGTTGSLDLTQGATNGPFTGAAIATALPAEVGTMRIYPVGAAYQLVFSANSAYVGTTTIQFTLSNAPGASAPGAVMLSVTARPDPTLDTDVIGLIGAQVRTAQGFANTQIDNFRRRLEQLHSGGMGGNGFGVTISLDQPPLNAYAPTEAGAGGEAVAAIGEAAPPPPSPLFDPVFGDLAFWSSGWIKLGTYDNGAINLESTLVGVSAGVDYRFSPDLAGGVGLGYGRDFTRIGTMGSRTAAMSVSMAVYGSYRPAPGFFIDGVAGYGVVGFGRHRFVAATGDLAMGLRYGDQYFGALTFGYEYSEGGLRVSPYGRLAGLKSTLDGFVESGAGIWDLAYGQQTVDSLAGVLGLRIEYDIPMEWGMLTPRGRIEYSHDFVGSSATSVGYADTGTLPFLLNVNGLATDHLALELGIDARFSDNATVGLDYGISFGASQSEQTHKLGAGMSVRF